MNKDFKEAYKLILEAEEITLSTTDDIKITDKDTVLYINNDKFELEIDGSIYDEIIIIPQETGSKVIIKNNSKLVCENYKNITKVEQLGSGITTCSYMFSSCSSLTSIDGLVIPDGVSDCSLMFDGCSKLTSIDGLVIPDNEIVDCTCMFSNCPSLTSIDGLVIPDSVTDCSLMFYNCISLTSIKGLVIPDSVTECYCMFNRCSSLTSIDGLVIPDSVTSCSGMFYNCSKLTSIKDFTIPKSVKKYNGIFYNCPITSYTNFKHPSNLDVEILFKS